MVRPGSPNQDSLPPCGVCGSAVFMARVESPRRMGATSGEVHEVRRCTEPGCASHPGNANHRLGSQA